VAAGDLIVREAGGVVTDGDGRPLAYNRPDPRVAGIIAAATPLHAALLARR
jgi:myo-inositol-1(or 4)-monophosphatase